VAVRDFVRLIAFNNVLDFLAPEADWLDIRWRRVRRPPSNAELPPPALPTAAGQYGQPTHRLLD